MLITWTTRIGLAAVLPLIFTLACARRQSESRAASSYVNPRLCAGCHASHWETFRHTGMARSFYRATPANMLEHFRDGGSFYHKASDRYYQMIRRGDRYFERRYQKRADG